MVKIVEIEKCDGCSTCADSCPVQVLAVVDKKIKIVDDEMCTDCGMCVEVCPNGVLNI